MTKVSTNFFHNFLTQEKVIPNRDISFVSSRWENIELHQVIVHCFTYKENQFYHHYKTVLIMKKENNSFTLLKFIKIDFLNQKNPH